MKRIFVSLPMRGRSELGIEQERHMIEEWCRRQWIHDELLFVPPLTYIQANTNPIVYNLGLSIQHMGLADMVVFSPDWRKAAGCRVEHHVCEDYGIHYLELGHTEDPGAAYKIVLEKGDDEC